MRGPRTAKSVSRRRKLQNPDLLLPSQTTLPSAPPSPNPPSSSLSGEKQKCARVRRKPTGRSCQGSQCPQEGGPASAAPTRRQGSPRLARGRCGAGWPRRVKPLTVLFRLRPSDLKPRGGRDSTVGGSGSYTWARSLSWQLYPPPHPSSLEAE